MTLYNDRADIFDGNVVSHRGQTITDIGSSSQYINYINNVFESKNSKIALVPNNMEGRPDLISLAAYGTDLLWWLIVEANNVYDYEFDLKAGTQILIPQI
tara:strand:+ start:566 stop:865 length:300 start_codon:yes stop_codon:yes gene_type:complete